MPDKRTGLLDFFRSQDHRSIPPGASELIVSLVLSAGGAALGGAIAAEGHYVVGGLIVGFWLLVPFVFPRRRVFGNEGVEWRSYLGRDREFGRRNRVWWGRRAKWNDFRSARIAKNPARAWLREKQGQERIVLRGGLPTVELFSNAPCFAMVRRNIESNIPIEKRQSRLAKIRNKFRKAD